ncbi:outer membrane protein assembly factor BamB family protein [Gimesia maris]|uniref:Outer membrane protein assembly factor BamB n=1 Tax=Gimesia maris TaxID=122 RepID=A0ABX5YP41_9PLAN|nr:PQQ-binding-like beta-propeller repeat protein [Gimesia maris]QEG17470.1 Outer membrane protein assembly factor BamB precursor [Gimesia maris]
MNIILTSLNTFSKPYLPEESTSMFRTMIYCLSILSVSLSCPADEKEPVKPEPIQVKATDWPWWRGPERNGIANPDQNPPLKWSATQNILWKSPIQGRGYSSPTVAGNRIFLTSADTENETQFVLCYDRETGKQLWKTVVFTGGLSEKGNKKSTHASSTVACDGTQVYINFINNGAAYTSALTLDGRLIWQTKITDYIIHQGYGSSPAIYQDLVIVSADNKGGGAIAAMNRADGMLVWKIDRPKTPNYPSPIILEVAGKEQLLMTGCDLVTGIAPLTGKKLWEIEGATTECVTSTVTNGEVILTSGGYPKNHMAAVKADGSGEVVWENSNRMYVPSMLIQDNKIYSVTDNGVAVCWDVMTGKELWKGRLGGTFSSSPVLVGDRIYVTNESGETYIFRASPREFELLGENKLGTEVFATPTFCDSRIYMRVSQEGDGKRQEMLYCIGRK